jgi:tetratricopeptide (TPR) repeat protein
MVKSKIKTLFIQLFAVIFSQTINAQDMKDRYFTWDEFVDNFGKEMVSASDVYTNMKKNGLVDFAYTVLDFDFESDKESKLVDLGNFLKEHYPYTDIKIKKESKSWILMGNTNRIPITEDILTYWALDMYKRGYEFDCQLVGYGAVTDKDNLVFPNLDKSKEDEYFEKGEDCYHSGDLSGALINWTLTLEINPNEPNSFYSRAIVKDELYTWKSALKDYDKAIELAPDFISAYTNRGALKDDNGDYKGAIDDYDKAIELGKDDIENLRSAYFNRGNSKQNLKDLKGACADWNKALEIGADYAQEKIDEFCK